MFKNFHCTLLIILLAGLCVHAQNLVYNGSFEEYLDCPDNGGQLNKAKYWFSANNGMGGSAEYFNACDNPGPCGVPNNFIGGHQYAKTGRAYVGMDCYNSIDEYREYIEGTLTSALQQNVYYCVSFYVSLSSYSSFGIDALGVYFTSDSLITHSPNVYQVEAQVENSHLNIITDKQNWVKISGSFIAAGGERFCTLGNFKSKVQTDTTILVNNQYGYTYYLIDDVSVYPCDAPVYAADAGPDQCVRRGESVSLGTHDLPDYQYYWFNADSMLVFTGAHYSLVAHQSETYYLRVSDFKYDVSWDTVQVNVTENCNDPGIYIPTIFSPNGDGINDLFVVRGKDIKRVSLSVYNRWGGRVCRDNNCWDGTDGGTDCAEGVYFYQAEIILTDDSKLSRSGNISLIR